MPELSPSQLARVDDLLDELLDMPDGTRAAYLERKCPDDPAVRGEVESLLKAAQSVGSFLATPAMLTPEPLTEDIPGGTRIGTWRISGRIGRGGMGVVYEAERADGDFRQRVAVKLLRHEAVSELPRFHVERQILARLEHPAIARLYDGGVTADGRPYMVMEFIEGRPITDYCMHVSAALPERMRLFLQVCEAVAYAHRNLIVHRDLKPANILVTPQGRVKLLDFGIAKLIDADRPDLTRTAAAPLTPLTAAPEQLLGQPVTTATDIYALGLLLFELLTDTQAWSLAGGPIAQAVRVILDQPAPVPSERAANTSPAPFPPRLLRGDFDAIVAKAVRKEPVHRYGTVEALKVDVDHALRGEPVAARSGARLYVFRRILWRYRWVTIAVTAILVSLAIGLGAAAWQAQRAAIERDAARRDAAREEALRYQLTRLFRKAIEERGSQPATAKAMIDNSALRVLREYRTQPQLAGQLVLTLADLYGALEDIEGAASLLEGFVKQASPDADPAALADARQKLANIELLQGHTAQAAQLLAQAEAFWTRKPNGYAEERLEGLGIRARIQRTSGDLAAASATEREAISQRIALSGRVHRETAILYNSHAITLTAANRLDEALEAYRQTTAIYRALGLGDELDAQIVLGNMGTLEYRRGHLREAEDLLRNAYQHEQSLAGDSAAVAAVMGFYGELLSETNRTAQALTVLEEAADIATRYAGPASPVVVQNRLYLGEAQLAAGNKSAARATLVATRDAALAQYGPKHLVTLRTQVSLAQLAMAERDFTGAHTMALEAVAALRTLGARAGAALAQALQVVADSELSQGNAREAIAPLREAIGLRARVANSGWQIAQSRERLGEALAAERQPGALEMLKQAVAGLSAELGDSHPETVRARNALARSEATLPNPQARAILPAPDRAMPVP
ncbi:MAG: protein kinase domain-containing protein [Steroidobacteraceae bacterium]